MHRTEVNLHCLALKVWLSYTLSFLFEKFCKYQAFEKRDSAEELYTPNKEYMTKQRSANRRNVSLGEKFELIPSRETLGLNYSNTWSSVMYT